MRTKPEAGGKTWLLVVCQEHTWDASKPDRRLLVHALHAIPCSLGAENQNRTGKLA